MKLGILAALVIAALGIVVSIYAFVINSTPYVFAKQAKQKPGETVNVAGKILHQTALFDTTKPQFSFEMVDEKGENLKVVYKGAKPGNFDGAPKASVHGTWTGEYFAADHIKTQCPSKYEAEEK